MGSVNAHAVHAVHEQVSNQAVIRGRLRGHGHHDAHVSFGGSTPSKDSMLRSRRSHPRSAVLFVRGSRVALSACNRRSTASTASIAPMNIGSSPAKQLQAIGGKLLLQLSDVMSPQRECSPVLTLSSLRVPMPEIQGKFILPLPSRRKTRSYSALLTEQVCNSPSPNDVCQGLMPQMWKG
jgi:hypothetical protein